MNVVSTITRHLPGRPQGDPAALREAAIWWNAAADGLRAAIGDAASRISTLASSWQGSAEAAFEQEWSRLAGAADAGAGELSGVAVSLNNAAAEIEAAQRKYDVVMGAAAVSTVIAIGATFITFGASDAADAAVVIAALADAVAAGEAASAVAGLAFAAAVAIAEEIATQLVVFLGVDLTAQAAIGAVVYPDHDPFAHLDFRAALGTAVGLATLPELGIESLAGRAVANAATVGGKDALGQEISSGRVDPVEVLFSGLQGAAGLGAVIGAGKAFAAFAKNAEEAASEATTAENAGQAALDDLGKPGAGPGAGLFEVPPEFRPQNPSGDYTSPSGPTGGQPGGIPTKVLGGSSGLARENASAGIVADHGYDVVQNPSTQQIEAAARQAGDNIGLEKNPDMLIENRVFDVYAPKSATGFQGIRDAIDRKVGTHQTQRVVINLQDWNGNVSDLLKRFADWPVTNLKEIKLILSDDSVLSWSASLSGWVY